MAGLRTKKNKDGTERYQVSFYDGKLRRYISLPGAYSRRDAEDVARVVGRIVDARVSGADVDARTRAWLEHTSDDLRDRLEAAGLIELERSTTCAEVFDAYFNAVEMEDFKETTRSNKRQARRRFERYFGATALVDDLTTRAVASFVNALAAEYSEATRAGTVRDLRRVFNWAKERELVDANPFAKVVRGSFKNKRREYFVSRDDYAALLDACPSPMFRAALALYRIGGLRKNEALLVQWADVDFPRRRLLVHSPKTDRYRGHDTRVIPLFPELRQELERLWDATPEGSSPYVISSNRTTIFKKLEQVVFLAGLNRWERLIQNLRSSRAIEIYNEYGGLAESEWIGHNPTTARDHYLHVLDETMERAAMGVVDPTTPKTTPTAGNFEKF